MPVTEVKTTRVVNPGPEPRDPNMIPRLINQIVWLFLSILEFFLVMRIIFLLLGAKKVGFSKFVYDFTASFVEPFTGIFSSPSIMTGSYFDLAALLAIIVWGVVGWLIISVVSIAFKR